MFTSTTQDTITQGSMIVIRRSIGDDVAALMEQARKLQLAIETPPQTPIYLLPDAFKPRVSVNAQTMQTTAYIDSDDTLPDLRTRPIPAIS